MVNLKNGMKRLIKIAGVIALFIGTSTVLLGAVYKIQSWGMPQTGGVYIDLLTIGVSLNIFGVGLFLLGTILPKPASVDRFELDETRIPQNRPQAQPTNRTTDDDLLV